MPTMSSIRKPYIYVLAAELLINTFSHLDAPDLLALREVCDHFKAIIDATTELRYVIELAAAGMLDGPVDRGRVSVKERLKTLRAWQKGWDGIDWSKAIRTRMIRPSFKVYPANSGILAAEAVRPDGEQGLVLSRLEVGSRASTEEKRWWIPNVRFQVPAVVMDATQDVLALIQYQRLDAREALCRVHFRSLSSGLPLGRPVPLPFLPPLYDREVIESGSYIHHAQIYDDKFAIQVRAQGDTHHKIFVYSWETGVRTSYITIYDENELSFALLDSKLAILGYCRDGGAELAVHGIHSGENSEPLLRLKYPFVHVTDIKVHADSAYTRGSFNDRVLFRPNKEHSMIVVALKFKNPVNGERDIFINIIPLPVIRRCLELVRSSPSRDVPWGCWATFVLPGSDTDWSGGHLSGLRYVQRVEPTHPKYPGFIIHDFNPYRSMKRPLAEFPEIIDEEGKPLQAALTLQPVSDTKTGDPMPVVSYNWPRRQGTGRGHKEFDDVMITEDHILLLTYKRRHGVDHMDISVKSI